MADERDQSAEQFLRLIQASRRGKFKIYIGMSAGVGKTYRMLQEAHALLRTGIDVKIGFIETHNRSETHALIEGLPIISRRKLFYKGRELEEMDVQAVINTHPEIAIVDELAHTNIPGSKNEKRWQDVLDILDAGISVISAVNIQHIESLYDEVQEITHIDVTERVPDRVLQMADEVVNIDLTADELITRLKDGKIYDSAKVQTALTNFFQPEKILHLRELALREVATAVERKIETSLPTNLQAKPERFLASISSNPDVARRVIRKTARLAAYYNSRWYVLYVQTPAEDPDRIRLDLQRHLINNFKLATELGAEVIQARGSDVVNCIMEEVKKRNVTTVCIGKPHFNLIQIILRTFAFNQLLNRLSESDTDLIILS
ncbi:sensor protein KdpD [Spirosoma sp.]|uniref:sensor protein KdpD n=1 Tax=Spirosoma sp. TaxID=1899569 RepID=UPI003B3A8EF3